LARIWIFDAGVSYRRRVTTALCVPQWQGSASSGAPRLTAGARRAAALVPADAVVTVPVLETSGEKVAGIRALDVLVENQRLTREALTGIDDRVICWATGRPRSRRSSRWHHSRSSSPGSGRVTRPSTSTSRRPACAGTASTT